MAKTFYVLDGHYLVYRAFFGMPQQLTSPSGEPTGATHGFCMTLLGLIRERRPDYLAVAMDVRDETVFRREIDSAYKANREAAPEALHIQADRIVSIIEAMGVPLLRVPGFEADDVMATLTERVRGDDVHLFLVSRDKDLHQLLSHSVSLFDPTRNEEIDPATLHKTKGYTPAQAVEIQTLTGDSTDNIPGINGVGIKTATKLINQFGTAEAVLSAADTLSPKLAERVKEFADQMSKTRQLVTLRRDVPFDFDLDACDLHRLKIAPVRAIFDQLGFTTVRETLSELARAIGAVDEFVATEVGSREGDSNTAGATALVDQSQYVLVDTPEALDEFLARLRRHTLFAMDTETTGLHPIRSELVGLSFAFQPGEAYYLPVRATLDRALDRDTVVAALKPVLEDATIGKVGHNIKYDALVLRTCGIKLAGIAFDTLLASFLLDPLRNSHSLDALSKTVLDHEMIPITELIGKGKNQITIDQVETRIVGEYAAEDADFTWRLYQRFEPRMRESSVEPLFRDIEMPLIDVLAEMEYTGITLDTDLLKTLGRQLEDRLIELTHDVHAAAGHTFNIDSTKQLAALLFDELGFKPVRKTKTGFSTDADTLATLAAREDHPIPGLVLEYRELAKLKSTYVDTLPTMVCAATGRVHASFNQTGAITGRLSSNDPNLQNIPVRTETGKLIRRAFVAGSADHVLLTADYSQVELRLMAHFSTDEALCDAFRRGQDVHRAVAAQVNGVPIDAVTSAQRSAAKAVNFGIMYGQTPFGLARSIGVSVAEARAFIDRYFEQYPGIKRFIEVCIERAKSTGYAETILGRRRPIADLQSRNAAQRALAERLAVNTVVQGSAADLIKKAMIDIHHDLSTGPIDGKMLIQVHDELVFEIPKSQVDALSDLVRRRMEGAILLDVPVVVDIAQGQNWAESK